MMVRFLNSACALVGAALMLGLMTFAQSPGPAAAGGATDHGDYVLGPGDQVTIWAVDLDEVAQKPLRIDGSGSMTLPLVGRMKAAGLSIGQFESQLTERLKAFQRNPRVTVSVTEYASQPVSVIGAVNHPGVYNLQGRKTLIEILSLAGGLREDAGYRIKVTRLGSEGPLPLPGAKTDPSGKFSLAEVGVTQLTAADHPEVNITVRAQDVISVPKAEMIYVMGEVAKPGAYPLGERPDMSVLEAVSLAGGFTRTASAKNAKVLRTQSGESKRAEERLDLRNVISGKSSDFVLKASDILYVPDNKPKAAALRAVEAAVNAGTGIAVWRSSR